MVYTCCVEGCFTQQEDKIGLRSFPPIDSLLFEQWKVATSNNSLKDMDNQYIRKAKKVCNLHFSEKYRKRPKFLKYDYPMLTENLMNDAVVDKMNIDDDSNTIIGNSDHMGCTIVQVETEEISIDADSTRTINNNLINLNQQYCKTEQVETEQMGIVSELNETEQIGIVSELNFDIEDVGKKVSVIKNGNIKKYQTLSRRQMQKRIFYLEKINKIYKIECNEYRNFKNLTPIVQQFMKSQINNVQKKKRGESYCFEDKVFALSIFKRSKKCYNYLKNVFTLPSKATLMNFSKRIQIDPGLNDYVFNTLKQHICKQNGIEDTFLKKPDMTKHLH